MLIPTFPRCSQWLCLLWLPDTIPAELSRWSKKKLSTISFLLQSSGISWPSWTPVCPSSCVSTKTTASRDEFSASKRSERRQTTSWESTPSTRSDLTVCTSQQVELLDRCTESTGKGWTSAAAESELQATDSEIWSTSVFLTADSGCFSENFYPTWWDTWKPCQIPGIYLKLSTSPTCPHLLCPGATPLNIPGWSELKWTRNRKTRARKYVWKRIVWAGLGASCGCSNQSSGTDFPFTLTLYPSTRNSIWRTWKQIPHSHPLLQLLQPSLQFQPSRPQP